MPEEIRNRGNVPSERDKIVVFGPGGFWLVEAFYPQHSYIS